MRSAANSLFVAKTQEGRENGLAKVEGGVGGGEREKENRQPENGQAFTSPSRFRHIKYQTKSNNKSNNKSNTLTGHHSLGQPALFTRSRETCVVRVVVAAAGGRGERWWWWWVCVCVCGWGGVHAQSRAGREYWIPRVKRAGRRCPGIDLPLLCVITRSRSLVCHYSIRPIIGDWVRIFIQRERERGGLCSLGP